MEDAWEELENANIELAYASDDDGFVFIYGYLDSKTPIPKLSSLEEASPYELPKIDWEAQWAEHGLDFHDGYVHVDLSLFGSVPKILRLEPGPGFGDLSHPTTRLVLRLMSKYVQFNSLVDIGCGSGILTLAAVAIGCPDPYGIDIDPEALIHAFNNAKINQMEDLCHFCLPTDFIMPPSRPIVIVMNMIMSEQKEALKMLQNINDSKGICLTSGVRNEETEEYLALTREWKWELIEQIEEGDWKGFTFKR